MRLPFTSKIVEHSRYLPPSMAFYATKRSLCVLVVTIAHEVAHYAHGFGSPLPRLHEHPHANQVVTHELEKRGLGNALQQCLTWIDQEWFAFYAAQREAGWPECSPKRDWSMPPTPQETLAISRSLQACTRQRARNI
jgi:hypothetical protein